MGAILEDHQIILTQDNLQKRKDPIEILIYIAKGLDNSDLKIQFQCGSTLDLQLIKGKSVC